jgi:RNA 2',3'-cyclic 3'-phosphodiesterase
MRLFVGVWPPAHVLDLVEALPRPDGARWTRRDQWHVTLRFHGEVDDPAPYVTELDRIAARHAARTVTIGPATKILGRGVLMIPVRGLDDLGAAFGNDRFTGHLTLARNARRELQGAPIAASFAVTHLFLVRSHLGGGPARYETIATAALG